MQDNETNKIDVQPAPLTRRKKLWIYGTILAVLLIIGGVVAAINWQNQQNLDAAEAAVVEIKSDGLSPETIKVSKGTVVKWLNSDDKLHKIIGDGADPVIDSDEDLKRGDDYQLLFDEAGTYTYHDALNPNNFKGTVIVE